MAPHREGLLSLTTCHSPPWGSVFISSQLSLHPESFLLSGVLTDGNLPRLGGWEVPGIPGKPDGCWGVLAWSSPIFSLLPLEGLGETGARQGFRHAEELGSPSPALGRWILGSQDPKRLCQPSCHKWG